MSWAVSACGFAPRIAEQLEKQFAHIKDRDPEEQATVLNMQRLLSQLLLSYDPDKVVNVLAMGSIGFKDYENKTTPYQAVQLKIEPIHFTS